MTTIKLTPEDFDTAANIAANSIPCRETLKSGDSSYCIVGCVVAAVSRRTKKSFRKTTDRFNDFNQGGHEVVAAIYKATNTRANLIGTNDSMMESYVDPTSDAFFYAPNEEQVSMEKNNAKVINKTRSWQVNTLLRLADMAYHKAYSAGELDGVTFAKAL